MKLIVFLVLFSVMTTLATDVVSQEVQVKINVKSGSLESVLKQVRDKSGYTFFYYQKDLKGVNVTNLNVDSKSIKVIMDKVLRGTGMEYAIEDKVVIITPIKIVNEQQQKIHIKGKVTDKKGKPMPGVTVKLEGVSMGTATNVNGEFNMDLPVKKGVLIFSFIGYETKKVSFTEKKTVFNITLSEERSDLDEVVVVAYGQQKKREITGAVSTLDSDDLKDVPASNLASLLQGKIAGVDVTLMSGAPGSSKVATTIRGFNELDEKNRNYSNPLWVVDGIPIDNMQRANSGSNVLSEIDPEMIESIQVLKDAAASSLYGSRAANGVILINTKKGRKGETMFKVNMSQSFSWLPEYPAIYAGNEMRKYAFNLVKNSTKPWVSMDGKTIVRYDNYNDAYMNPEGLMWAGYIDGWWGNKYGRGYSNAAIQDSLDNYYNNSTNWPGYLFNTGRVTNANIQASGGSDKFLYNFGVGYYSEKGIVAQTGFDRANLIANMQLNLKKNLTLNFRTFASFSQRNNSASNSLGTEGIDESIPSWPYETSSFIPGKGSKIYDIKMSSLSGREEEIEDYTLRTSAGLQWNITKDLRFTSNNSINLNLHRWHFFLPSKYSWNGINSSADKMLLDKSILNENMLTWTKSIDEIHNFELLAGTSYQNNLRHYLKGNAQRGPNDNIKYVIDEWPDLYKNTEEQGGNYEAVKDYGSGKYESVLLSFFGRFNYNYKKKYLVSATIRRDGSSQFGKAQPWGNFPSVSAGWAFTEEDFMDIFPLVDFGKLRASYGVTGKNYSREYLAYGLYNAGPNYNFETTMGPGMLYNPELTWEETKQTNIGLDLDLFNYKIGLTLDYYKKTSDQMLMTVFTPGDYSASTGYTKNSGKLMNEGIELSIKWDVVRTENFFYRMNFNIAKNSNKFLDTYNHRDYNPFIIGRPVKGIYVLEDAGIAEKQEDIPFIYEPNGDKKYLNDGVFPFHVGDMLYVDQNNDNEISASDYLYKGSPLPDAIGGMVHEMKWKDFDLSCYFSFSLGKTLSNSIIASAASPSALMLSGPVLVDPRNYSYWEKPGDAGNVDFPTSSLGGKLMNFTATTDRYISNVHYLKMKSFTLGYTLPKTLAKRLGIAKARAFVTGENMFTLTNFKHIDPEAIDINSGFASLTTYPLARKVTIGLTINL